MCLFVNPEFAELEAVSNLSNRELEELVGLCAVNFNGIFVLVEALELVSLNLLVDECPCLVVVRTFELPAYRIAAGIVVGVGTSYERILLNSNWFAGNDDSPSITCAAATELGVGIVVNKTCNRRVAPAIATSYDSITNIVLVEALVVGFRNGQLVACCPTLVGIGSNGNRNLTSLHTCYGTIGSNSCDGLIGRCPSEGCIVEVLHIGQELSCVASNHETSLVGVCNVSLVFELLVVISVELALCGQYEGLCSLVVEAEYTVVTHYRLEVVNSLASFTDVAVVVATTHWVINFGIREE